MEKRVFICTHSQLPRGDANSNYIFHMALSLANVGWKVFAIGRSKENKKTTVDTDGITCINLPKIEKIPAKIEGHLWFGQRIVKELKSLQIKKEDYIVLYGGYVSLFKAVSRNLDFLEKGHITTCVVEWPTENQFIHGKYDLDYQLWKYVFNKMLPLWKKVVVISENLNQHFREIGCETFLLPPMINCTKKISGIRVNNEKVHFIYAGADTQKDAIVSMLLSVTELSDEERNRFVFHITSLTLEKAKSILGKRANLLEEYADCLKIHGWMEYDELINLYYSADYLLLARETNQFTISNFPSKVPEMMNYGIIPVCSEVGDYTSKYLRDSENSIVFKGASPSECADAIRRAITISQECRHRMSENTILSARYCFDYRVWGNKLSDFISC